VTTVDDVARFLESFAPTSLAADWDNVGLLIGDRARPVGRVMTCLTVSPNVVDEAIAERVDLIVVHHPLPFRPLGTITADTVAGNLVWRLASAGISLYSPHTAFDSALDGINRRLADGLGLVDVEPLVPIAASDDPQVGIGRRGRLPKTMSLAEFTTRAKRLLHIDVLDVVGDDARPVQTVGVACGSAGELMKAAIESLCDVFVTGEARFHTAVEADAVGIALVLVGHYPAERFGIEHLAAVVDRTFPDLTVWPSRQERDPLRRV
jgi:dinuclear metal center YbgI/SA1388 family protein